MHFLLHPQLLVKSECKKGEKEKEQRAYISVSQSHAIVVSRLDCCAAARAKKRGNNNETVLVPISNEKKACLVKAEGKQKRNNRQELASVYADICINCQKYLHVTKQRQGFYPHFR